MEQTKTSSAAVIGPALKLWQEETGRSDNPPVTVIEKPSARTAEHYLLEIEGIRFWVTPTGEARRVRLPILHILSLADGDGELEIRLIDHETYLWITGPAMSKEDGEKYKGESSWEDKLCPERIKHRIWERERKGFGMTVEPPVDDDGEGEESDDEEWDGSYKTFKLTITSGSWQSDRANMAPPFVDDAQFTSLQRLIEWVVAYSHDFMIGPEEFETIVY